jgi:hypothetical protein
MIGKLVINELERMWKEAVTAQLQVLSRNCSGRTAENREGHTVEKVGVQTQIRPPRYILVCVHLVCRVRTGYKVADL